MGRRGGIYIIFTLTQITSATCCRVAALNPHLQGKCWTEWVYERGIRIDFSRQGNTDGQCDGGVLQRQVTAGMSERELVHVSGDARGAKSRAWRAYSGEKCISAGLDDPVRIF